MAEFFRKKRNVQAIYINYSGGHRDVAKSKHHHIPNEKPVNVSHHKYNIGGIKCISFDKWFRTRMRQKGNDVILYFRNSIPVVQLHIDDNADHSESNSTKTDNNHIP